MSAALAAEDLAPRREPPQRMVVDAPEPSILRRHPCAAAAGPDSVRARPASGFTPGGRGALLRARRECCCPGLRRKYGTAQGIRLRRRSPAPWR